MQRKATPQAFGILLGAHMSIAGGMWRVFERAVSLGCTTVQLFVKNTTQWHSTPLKSEDIALFHHYHTATRITPVIAHSSYLINLCAVKRDFLRRSRTLLVDEIRRCAQLGISYLVFHPGAHMGKGEQEGIERVAESLNIVHETTADEPVMSVLECTAGQGTTLGYTFEHIRAIIDRVNQTSRVGVCVDTCHIFAAGYDIRTEDGYQAVFREFDEVIGFHRLKVLHLNDSKRECGSRIDRHEHIGKGALGLSAFRLLMNDERFSTIPKILETPKSNDLQYDRMNIRTLLQLVRKT
ncbi:MAG: deoxyribonuclease IV [Bacteroidetes bacterium]|nr:deoxyribonuclease IV [Bacteroidota bacterium]